MRIWEAGIDFLGHVVGADGIKVDPKKIEVIKNWPQPTDVHSLRQYLGLAHYFRKFIRGFAEMCRPLHALLGKGMGFAWSQECDGTFQRVRDALMNAPVLALPDFAEQGKPFEVICDASYWHRGSFDAGRQAYCVRG